MSINSCQNIALENVDAAKTLDADSVSEQRFNNTRLYIKRFFELIRKKSPQLLLKVRSVFNRKRDKKLNEKKNISLPAFVVIYNNFTLCFPL